MGWVHLEDVLLLRCWIEVCICKLDSRAFLHDSSHVLFRILRPLFTMKLPRRVTTASHNIGASRLSDFLWVHAQDTTFVAICTESIKWIVFKISFTWLKALFPLALLEISISNSLDRHALLYVHESRLVVDFLALAIVSNSCVYICHTTHVVCTVLRWSWHWSLNSIPLHFVVQVSLAKLSMHHDSLSYLWICAG